MAKPTHANTNFEYSRLEQFCGPQPRSEKRHEKRLFFRHLSGNASLSVCL